MERRTKTGNRWASSGYPIRPATLKRCYSRKVSRSIATSSSPGRVLLQLGAELQGEDVRARVLPRRTAWTPRPQRRRRGCGYFCAIPSRWIDRAAAAGPEAARKAVWRAGPAAKPPTVAGGNGDGDVSLVLMLDLRTEVENGAPGRFKVSPQIAGRSGGVGRGGRADGVEAVESCHPDQDVDAYSFAGATKCGNENRLMDLVKYILVNFLLFAARPSRLSSVSLP